MKIDDVRSALSAKSFSLRTEKPVGDVALLRDIADAFKHHRQNRVCTNVRISTDVVPVGGGFGEMHWGKGKYGGAEQVIITTKDANKLASSCVLQNVFDAWMLLLGESDAAHWNILNRRATAFLEQAV